MFGQGFDSPHLHQVRYQNRLKARKTLILRAFCFSSPLKSLRIAPVYLRVTVNGGRFETSTQHYLPWERWSVQSGKAKRYCSILLPLKISCLYYINSMKIKCALIINSVMSYC